MKSLTHSTVMWYFEPNEYRILATYLKGKGVTITYLCEHVLYMTRESFYRKSRGKGFYIEEYGRLKTYLESFDI